MPKIDLETAPRKSGSIYPAPYDAQMAGRSSIRLSEAGGLSQFGANIVILEPGARSSLRHWHKNEDEFAIVLEGTLMLHQDEGEAEMQAGDCAAFPAGDPDGHCFINRSNDEARFLVVGTRASHEVATYSDVDLRIELSPGKCTFSRKDGTPYVEPEEQ
ncbi:MAG: cupin domain-containing protein [Pseudomonadota bacterium]